MFQVLTEAQLDVTSDEGLEFWGGEGSERRRGKPQCRIFRIQSVQLIHPDVTVLYGLVQVFACIGRSRKDRKRGRNGERRRARSPDTKNIDYIEASEMNSRVSTGCKDKDIVEDETEEFGRQPSKSVDPVQEFVVLPHSNVCSVGRRSRFCWALANNFVECRIMSGHHPQLELHPETLSLNRE